MPPRAPRFLVTAGNTREPIDDVRAWSNIFTGNTGYAIAKALAKIAPVDLLTSNASHHAEASADPNSNIHPTLFTSHADLRALLADRMKAQRYDAVFMTAAVADYTPAGTYTVTHREPLPDGSERWTVRDVQAGKVKSSHPNIAILGTPTEKLIDLFRTEWDYAGLLVKFKLEVGRTPEELIAIGQASRRASRADYLVANTLDMVTGASAGAFLLSDHPPEWIPRADLPARLARLVPQ